MTRDISNNEDILDSRDIIARVAELEAVHEEDFDERDELQALKQLVEQGKSSPDWCYGETLIRDSYFEEYAQQLAEDIGAIDRNANWPLGHIDWEAAAEALKQDYMDVDFSGVTYYIRA